MFKSSFWFFVILIILVFGFAFHFMILDEQESEEFGDVFNAFLTTFSMSVLGDFDLELFDTMVSPDVAKLMFLILEICILVTMLNALISHMTDAYTVVREITISVVNHE
eukprot:UN32348